MELRSYDFRNSSKVAPRPAYARLTVASLPGLSPSARTLRPGRSVRCLASYRVRCGLSAAASFGVATAGAPMTVVRRLWVRSMASRSRERRAGPASARSWLRARVSRTWGGTIVQKTGSKPVGLAVMAAMWHWVMPLSLPATMIDPE
ncbi:hypothetical protein SALBM135S_02778 [Streptomyces alboniger]